MQKMVQRLLDTGYAYITPQAIYFDTSRVSDYTKLSLQKMENNITGTGHGAVQDSAKKNPSDFSLWFFKTGAHESALQTWESPFHSPLVPKGLGFPGWHIECSAMSKHFLGETFDIHMGGIEHIPVHHTNEIAQSESANQNTYVNYWLHNEHLTVDGAKMAKSEGTSITIDDIVARGHNPLSLRFFFLQAHYRSKQNFTWEALAAAETAYTRILRFAQSVKEIGKISHKYSLEFKEALSDDLNTSAALSVAFEILKDSSLSDADKKATLLDFDSVLGLNLAAQSVSTPIPPQIQKLAEERNVAKIAKDWAKADDLRLQIEESGYSISDTKDGFEIQRI
jgi:cysteinyl-tRNA synthetase